MDQNMKLIQHLLRFPGQMDFSDVIKVLKSMGYSFSGELRGNHAVFSKGQKIVTVITEKGRKVCKFYLKRLARETDMEEYYEELRRSEKDPIYP